LGHSAALNNQLRLALFFSRRLASDFIDESSEQSRLQTGVKTAPAKPENHWRSRQDLNLQPPA